MDMLTWEGEAPGDSTLDKEPQATGKSGLNGLPVGRIPTLHQLVIQHQGGSIVCKGYIVFGNKLLGHHLTVLFLTVRRVSLLALMIPQTLPFLAPAVVAPEVFLFRTLSSAGTWD